MATKQTEMIVQFLKDNKETVTCSEAASNFKVSKAVINNLVSRYDLQGFLVPESGRGKIGVEAHLQGETRMQEPTKADMTRLRQICDERNLPFEKWGIWWDKTKDSSIAFYNREAIEREANHFQELIAEMKKHAPKYKKRKIDPTGEHMLVLPQADIHIGKWSTTLEVGSEYNSAIAVERAKQGTDELVSKGRAFGVKQFVLCIGNDILHTDNGKTTTSNTPQDTDGSWFSNFRLAKALYVSIIEQLALYGDVHLIFVPSNHDWRTGYALSEAVAAHFHNHPNVHPMVTERHRKYVVYGNNLMMFSHGDGAKEKDLHWHLATEASEAWSKTSHRYIYLGHLHHKIKKVQGHQNGLIEKDKIGFTEIDATVQAEADKDVNIEYVRSSSGSDSWHDRNGYTSKPAMEAFLHHHSAGQVARFTQWF